MLIAQVRYMSVYVIWSIREPKTTVRAKIFLHSSKASFLSREEILYVSFFSTQRGVS